MLSAAQENASVAARDRWWNRVHLGILAAFLLLAYTYVIVQQPRYGPDEPRHVAYIQMLLDKRELPEIRNGVETDGAHSQHPPLYHMLAAPFFAAARPFGLLAVYYLLKSVSPLLGLGALLFFLGTLKRALPDRPAMTAAALALVALLPEFLLESCVINNDTLTNLLTAWFLWLLVRQIDEKPSLRAAVVTGLVLAAIANTKSTGLTLAPLWPITLLFRARRLGGPITPWLRDAVVGLGVLLLLGTWWYLLNIQRYGQPVLIETWGGILGPRDAVTGRTLTPLEVYTTGAVVTLGERSAVGLFQSFWSQIDWIPEPMRLPIWWTLLVFCAAGWIGLVLRVRHRLPRKGRASVPPVSPGGVALAILGGAFALNYTSVWYLSTFVHLGMYQGGRYLMPAVYGAMGCLAAGWDRLLPVRQQITFACAVAVALLALNALCLIELVTHLNPTYVQPWPGG